MNDDAPTVKRSGRLALVALWPTRSEHIHYGLFSANDGFLEALIRHSTLEEIHVFTTEKNSQEFSAAWKPHMRAGGVKLKVMPVPLLPECLGHFDYHALHWPDPYIDDLVALRNARQQAPCPVTGVTHTLSDDHFLLRMSRLAHARLLPCDAIVCTSPAARRALRELVQLGIEQIGARERPAFDLEAATPVLPLGVHLPAQPPPLSEVRARLGLREQDRVLLCLARFDAAGKCDLQPLLVALHNLVHRHGHDHLKLVLAGSLDQSEANLGVVVDRINQLHLGRHVRLRLNFPPEEKALLLAACDVFVLPADSHQESFGLAPLEAMACGKPVVLSDWNGYRDLVEDGRSGLLVPTYSAPLGELIGTRTYYEPSHRALFQSQGVAVDVGALTAGLDRLLREPGLRETMGDAARARVAEHYDWRRIIPRYEALWAELRERAPARSPDFGRPLPTVAALDRAFGEYPSRQLGDDFPLRTSAHGRGVVEGTWPLGASFTIGAMLQDVVIEAVLRHAVEPVTVGELVTKAGIPREVVVYNLLWMLKHDLLEPAATEAAATPASAASASL